MLGLFPGIFCKKKIPKKFMVFAGKFNFYKKNLHFGLKRNYYVTGLRDVKTEVIIEVFGDVSPRKHLK